MVCDWGMSELGMISFGDKQDQVFLGKELSRAQNYSEETAQKIDSAIKEIIDQQYERAKQILLENLDALHASANALLEYETIEGKHIHEILEHGKIVSEISKSSEDLKKDELVEDPTEQTKENSDKKSDSIEPGTDVIGAPA
jgi:cell division protease FtsH